MANDLESVARPVTSGPMHHFFGYFGIQPWDITGSYLLCLEVPFDHRPPRANDKARIGMVDLSGPRFVPLAESYAWNFQQGAMLHWIPGGRGTEIVFNDRDGGRLVSVVLDVRTGERRTLPRPVSALSHDGKNALSINFSRLQRTRPGYGYAGIGDPFAKEHHPERDGIYLLDLESGKDELLVSLADVFACGGKPSGMKNNYVYFNHTSFNKDDSRFAFLVEWVDSRIPSWAKVWRLRKLGRLTTAMFTANKDGSDLRRVIDYGVVSHFDWRSAREILVWASVGRLGEGFYLISDDTNEFRVIGADVLTQDGHCSFSPDGRWILTDTYPDREHRRTLKIFRWDDGPEFILGKYYSPPRYDGEIRCDLHPRFDRTGSQVCFDSVHDGSRQVYVMDLSDLMRQYGAVA